MRFVQFTHKDSPTFLQFGVELDDGGNVVDLTHICPSTLNFIRGGEYAMEAAVKYLKTSPTSLYGADIELDAPISGMDKVRRKGTRLGSLVYIYSNPIQETFYKK